MVRYDGFLLKWQFCELNEWFWFCELNEWFWFCELNKHVHFSWIGSELCRSIILMSHAVPHFSFQMIDKTSASTQILFFHSFTSTLRWQDQVWHLKGNISTYVQRVLEILYIHVNAYSATLYNQQQRLSYGIIIHTVQQL